MQTILVIDDELDFAEAVHVVLEHAGYRVLVAPNGKDGLARIPELQPHLVILDLMMPIMSGPATLDALREEPTTANIPVILVSSVWEDTAREFTTRYDRFLRKPFDTGALLTAVHSLIGTA